MIAEHQLVAMVERCQLDEMVELAYLSVVLQKVKPCGPSLSFQL